MPSPISRLLCATVAGLILATATLPDNARASDLPYRSAQEIIDAAPDSAWRTPNPDDLLYMDIADGRVLIELAPRFAPEHVANIRALARAGFWNGLALYRAQDNFVVQFGDPAADRDTERKPLPEGAKPHLPAEFERDSADVPAFTALPDRDGWAAQAGFADGFPAARDPATGKTWLTHCYATVGAARDTAPDSSTGTELYVVIGQAPRQLDRNITVVGRVLKGMELLSAIPRGPEPLGMYADAKRNIPIRAIGLIANLPANQRTPIQALRIDAPAFAEATEARRNRRDRWYRRPAGHIDLCNVPLPVRDTAAAATTTATGKH